jgi:threonine dehydrogenase-like Zn-dependent dehydrogenase
MRAVSICPHQPGSIQMEQIAEPLAAEGLVLARTLAVGICGTDHKLVAGRHGTAPPGRKRLVLGHESLACVLEAPSGSGFAAGDALVGIVRYPDPQPCANCAVGEWDMCRNGGFTERGINRADGFAAERFRVPAPFAVAVPREMGLRAVLLEPASVVAKAWEQVERIGRRTFWAPHNALVTGAGPVGMLAALFGVQRGLEVHVLDRAASGIKPRLVRELGASYHSGYPDGDFDVVLECTGAPAVVQRILATGNPNRIVCLLGLSSVDSMETLQIAGFTQTMVGGNGVVFGSVNANRRHYDLALEQLQRADPDWLKRLLTRRVPLQRWQEAYERRQGDVKTVLMFDPDAFAD